MNKINILLTIALLLTACGPDFRVIDGKEGPTGTNGVDGKDGKDGIAGINGTNGSDGEDGLNSLVKAIRSDLIDELICTTESGVIITVGLDRNRNGVLNNDEEESITFVCDGEVGPMGAVGPQGPSGPTSPVSIASIVDPCGDVPGIYDEVLLKLANGTLLASFSDNSNGKNTRFSVLPPGNYVTTDGSNCSFTVLANLSVVW